ncbi:MAG: ribulose-phosphate 3-epimerase [Candidatus Cloacimonadota bacterium]
MNSPMVAVSVLSANFSRLGEEVLALSNAGADILHLDIMDGHYVPNLSFGLPVLQAVSKVSKLPLDAHLMVMNPDEYVEVFAELGVAYFSFHQETVIHSHRMVQKIKSLGMKAGIALNPATPLSSLEEIISELDFVLIMSVNPGFSGQSFIPSTLDKIRRLKEMITRQGLDTLIEIDGGVTAANANEILEAGADILVSASYVFSHTDYAHAISQLKLQ